MQEYKDPAITLFGKKIRFPTEEASEKERNLAVDEKETETDKNPRPSPNNSNTRSDDMPSDSGNVTPRTPSVEEESSKNPVSDENETEKSLLKKPEKIVPCPRCNSMDTKFCYFNNYNVNQPRHFCKACQRYWTAGGTMRNVPVGAGRRKNKHSRHVITATVPDQIEPDKVLSFGDESSSGSSSAEAVPWPSYPPFFPVPFFPYWPNMPWVTAPVNPELPVLGKRAREGVLVPKTLRFDDPSEAAKSSIWATLGIENGGAGTFRAFRSTGELEKKAKSGVVEPSPTLMANPAAMSRSVNFHERS